MDQYTDCWQAPGIFQKTCNHGGFLKYADLMFLSDFGLTHYSNIHIPLFFLH
ncbi:hypothetical protein C8P63_11493 [Melghirimyces profundicolus]|uniref:Uncharacterized protein n=1 Tax=Melghirimyces profundicolus TaxID=1242148 RepID=A0A2T6BS60_9BACL|nr:hypothetical protein C8P63_11493 [Melghirimyces profundicolus]